jgi:hypothetical protein
MTRGLGATLIAAVATFAMSAITPTRADTVPVFSDILRLTQNGVDVLGPPVTASDTPIAGTLVETPGVFNVIEFPLALDVLKLTSLPIAFTELDGSISDIVGVCSPCADGNPAFQGIFFISDPFEITGPFIATFRETGQPQDVSLLLSDSARQNGLIATFASDVEAVPGPVTGAGLPGLILACGILLVLARRRRQFA